MLLRLRRARTLARVGAITGLASLAYYVVLLIGQDHFEPGSLLFIAIIIASVFAAYRSVDDPHRARKLLLAATGGFAIIGIISIATIGALFLLAALYTGIGAVVIPTHIEGD